MYSMLLLIDSDPSLHSTMINFSRLSILFYLLWYYTVFLILMQEMFFFLFYRNDSAINDAQVDQQPTNLSRYANDKRSRINVAG